jgi:energy-coupling factor transport system ATP-binding protein
MNPKILLLDEPTSALDPIAAEEVLATLSRLVHDLGLTVIVAEHKLERVLQFVDRVIYVQNQNQVSIGLPEEILKDSPLAPPIIHLSRALKSDQVPMTVRDARRGIGHLAQQIAPPLPRTSLDDSAKQILAIEDLHVRYGQKTALKKVSLSVRAGEVVAVMGRNGAGKSTLLSSAIGLRELESGSVQVLESDPRTLHGAALISHVGYVPQEASDLLYGQTVAEELQNSDRDNQVPPGTTAQKLCELLPTIDTSLHPRDLSEGERLCLVLAIVLAKKPALLVLDEPTRGLDYQAKERLVSAIGNTVSDSTAVILASHDVELVADVATRVVVLADGEIVADGEVTDILTSSPAFAPQVTKVLAPARWLTVSEVLQSLSSNR